MVFNSHIGVGVGCVCGNAPGAAGLSVRVLTDWFWRPCLPSASCQSRVADDRKCRCGVVSRSLYPSSWLDGV